METQYCNQSNYFQLKESNMKKIDYCNKVLKKLAGTIIHRDHRKAEKILTLLKDADIRFDLLEMHIHKAYLTVNVWADSHVFEIRIDSSLNLYDDLIFWPIEHKYPLDTTRFNLDGWVYFSYSEFKKLASSN